jgi:hypothetical protein
MQPLSAGRLDLCVLSGDVNSAGLGMNERGEMVGASFGAAGTEQGKPSYVPLEERHDD